jgi:hypothetical protein
MVCTLHLEPVKEFACGACPVLETEAFIEAAYRAGYASWEELEHYTACLKQYQKVTRGVADNWVKFALAEIARIPVHHRPAEIRGGYIG